MALRYTAGFDGYNAYTRQFHDYDIEIYDVNYIGDPKEIEMGANPMEGEFSNTSNDPFPTLIPSFMDLNLIATEAFQLNEMYTDDEKALKVVMKMDGVVYGNYFVIPDGTSESFIDPPYDVSVRCTDGLGILDGYDYLDITGRVSVLEAIMKCLSQLGLGMNINTFADISYTGMPAGSDVYLQTLINQEQFADDKGVPMNCEEVLESLLSEWVSGLVQQGGEWYLFRWPDVVRTVGDIAFKKYDSALVSLGDHTVNIDKVLGNESGDVIHCRADQIRAVNMPYKRVSIHYDYGFLMNLLDYETTTFKEGAAAGEFDGWMKLDGVNAIPSALEGEPSRIIGKLSDLSNARILLKDMFDFSGISKMRFEMILNIGTGDQFIYNVFIVDPTDGDKEYVLDNKGKWRTGPINFPDRTRFNNYTEFDNGDILGLGQTINAGIDFDLPAGMPASAYLRVALYPVRYSSKNVNSSDTGYVQLYSAKLMPVANERGILSETRTIENLGNYTKVPDTIETINGQTDFYGYKGSMFKPNGDLLIQSFVHAGRSDSERFLTLAAKDILFQNGRPMNRYEGSTIGIYGFLSRFVIGQLNGNFMPVSMRVNFKECVSRVVLSEVSNEEVPFLVKPVIYEYDDTSREGVRQGGVNG